MNMVYTLQKLDDTGKTLKVTFTKRKDGSLVVRYFRPGYIHAVKKVTRMPEPRANRLWKELVAEGYNRIR